ncbi:hypothetical protein ACFWY9_35855 [Amycolatopsis sp. NPDC059027]|uniref:hypothetical protein n=1 Tax=Amycolatopsis sp. NPDC059027 TaxID=3346709 RepID=UPI0036700237
MTLTQTVQPSARSHEWSHDEQSVLVGAAREAPPRRLSGGWVVQIHDGAVDVFERTGFRVPGDDRAGRARLIHCGAVLANLEVAVRVLGWVPVTVIGSAPEAPDRIARITAGTRTTPSTRDRAGYRAVFGHRSRSDVDTRRLARTLVEQLRPRLSGTGVRVRAVRESDAHARIGERYRLADHREHPGGCFAIAVGLESRSDLIRAGQAAQYLLLAAAELGAVGDFVIAPFRYPKTRASLAGELALPGFVELFVSIAIPEPRRRPLTDPEYPAARP